MSAAGQRVAELSGRWSDADVWGGVPPARGASVLIPDGVTVSLDAGDVSLAGLTIAGSLVASDADFTLSADWILVDGRLQVGTAQQPYAKRAAITLKGSATDLHPRCGAKFLCAGPTGQIDLHGASANKVSWSQLGKSAEPGDTSIELKESVDWVSGDQVVIAPSGFDAFEAEPVTVTNVSGSRVSFSPALKYRHHGRIEPVAGRSLDMRAEVGLLTRNIVVQGDEQSQHGDADYPIGFGGHGIFLAGSTVRISGVEFRRMGQTRGIGRYPVHWHLGVEGQDEYIRRSSVHKSFHRGIVTHGISHVRVESNVTYDTFSHAYVFSEDGNELSNRFEGNLSVLVRKLKREDFAFPRDDHSQSNQAEVRPAGFWGRNYHNPLLGNHSAGTDDGVGFLFDLVGVDHRMKQSITRRTDAIEFDRNLAHTNDMSRGKATNPLYGPLTRGHGLLVARYGSGSTEVVFKGFSSYKNGNGGIWIEDDYHTVDGATIADSAQGIVVMASQIRNSVMAQRSDNTIGGVFGIDRGFMRGGGALPGGILLHRSTYGTEARVDNVTVQDFADAAVVVHKEARPSEGNRYTRITAINTPRLFWGGGESHPERLKDADGSLTGTGLPMDICRSPLPGGEFVPAYNAYVAPSAR
jgi:cell surface hyaluronidase